MKKKKTERQKAWGAADALWRKIVKARAKGKCEWCLKPGSDCHHMVGRRNFVLRCKTANGVYLCKSCHMRFHNIDSSCGWETFKKSRPLDYKVVQKLKYLTLKDVPIDPDILIEYLKEDLKDYEQ